MEEDADRFLSFEEVRKKYWEPIFNLILRLVGDRDYAKDLTEETFVNAYRHRDKLSDEVRVSTWLHQIAVNNCKNWFNQRRRN